MGRGRGHTREEPKASVNGVDTTKKLRAEHGQLLIPLPNALKQLGAYMSQPVVIEHTGSNPLNWEIRVKPLVVEQPETKETPA